MPIDFPNTPTDGQVYSAGGRTWTYNSSTSSWDGGVRTVYNNPTKTTLTGNGVLSSFPIMGADGLANPAAVSVDIDGISQEPIIDFNVASGVINFTSPLPNGSKAVVVAPTHSLSVGQAVLENGHITGTTTFGVGAAAAFLTAVGALPTSGGTATNLTIAGTTSFVVGAEAQFRTALGAGAAGGAIFVAAAYSGVGSVRALMGLDVDSSAAFGSLTVVNNISHSSSSDFIISNPNNKIIVSSYGVNCALFDASTFRSEGTADSSSATTGAIQTKGGIGVAKSVYVGGTIKAVGKISASVPSYADDAAADADATLLSGQLYRTTAGGRTIFQKP